MDEVGRPAWSTRAAVWTIAALTCGFVGFAVIALLTRDTGIVGSRDAVAMGLDGRSESTVRLMGAVAMLVISALTTSLAVGIARRREGARYAAFMTFGLLGFISLAAALPGLLADPPASGAPVGIAVGLTNIAVVALLLHPATADDFDLTQRQRDRRAARAPSR